MKRLIALGIASMMSLLGLVAMAGTVRASGPPNAISGFRAVPGRGEAFVFWDPPSGGNPVDTYTVTASPGGHSATVPSEGYCMPPDTPGVPEEFRCTHGAVLVGLTNGTTYSFTVVASNASGDGPLASPSATVTPSPSAPVPITSFGPPDGSTYALDEEAHPFTATNGDPGNEAFVAYYQDDVFVGSQQFDPYEPDTYPSLDTSTLGLHTVTVTATSFGGAGPVSFIASHTYCVGSCPLISSDTTRPTISFTTPLASGTYTLGQVVNADYACRDEVGGTGLASCVGDVPSGSTIDTSTVGNHTFTVVATDGASNRTARHHTYSVSAFPAIDLGSLDRYPTYAADINDNGQVVGTSRPAGYDVDEAFSWTRSGGMVDLGRLGGSSYPAAVNSGGQVVGKSPAPPFYINHAFSWTPGGGLMDIGTLGGHFSDAAAVNDAGLVVGYSDTSSGSTHAFSWCAAGSACAATQAVGMVDIGTLGGNHSRALAVNDDGQVVGNSTTVSGETHAFSWTRATGMVDLGTLGGSTSQAVAINRNGQVVGWSEDSTGDAHAATWCLATSQCSASQTVGIVDLHPVAGYASSFARYVNNNGQVVGDIRTPSGGSHAFSWTQAGGAVDMGTLGGANAAAAAVNDAGMVVGGSNTSTSGVSHAFSWTQGGGMIDLGSVGGLADTWAVDVNSSGQIIGQARLNSGTSLPYHAVLWETGTVADTTPPGVGGPSLSLNPVAETESTDLSADASDSGSGVDHGEYFSGADPGPGNGIPMAFNGSAIHKTISGLPVGTHTLKVRAVDVAGNWSAVQTIDLTVSSGNTEGSSQTFGSSGGTVTTDPADDGASVADPVETTITSPVGGTVTVSETTVTTPPLTAYDFVGQQINITVPQVQPDNDPYTFVFTADASLLPAGPNHTDPNDPGRLKILKNGNLVVECPGFTVIVKPDDPCVTSRALLPDGDLRLTVLSTYASAWNFVVSKYHFKGFFAPVDNRPVLNIGVKAGSAVPMRFSLGGDQGLDIFATGSPGSGPITCSPTASTDTLEETVTAAASTLTYAAGSDRYEYVWKTNKSWAGTCRQVVITFADGSVQRANFRFLK